MHIEISTTSADKKPLPSDAAITHAVNESGGSVARIVTHPDRASKTVHLTAAGDVKGSFEHNLLNFTRQPKGQWKIAFHLK